MKRYLVFLFLFPCLLSCSEKGNSRQDIYQRLKSWDQVIYKQPAAVIDSLNKIKDIHLSSQNAAYYSLLYTIASERTDNISKDSLISTSLEWYKKEKDSYNLCRSYLFKGILLYDHSHIDSSAYEHMKEAENIYLNEDFDDKNLGSLLYLYLGKLSLHRSESHSPSIAYFNKSLELSTEINSVEDIQAARLGLFWIYLAERKFGEALSNMIIFEDSKSMSPSTEYNVYNALSSYYALKKEYNISTEYIKKMLGLKGKGNLEINEPKLYHSLSLNFKKSNIDSALYYSKMAVNSIKDSVSRENHFYYRSLADLYLSLGDAKNAAENYRKAYLSYVSTYYKISKTKLNEVEKKYDVSRKEIEMARLKSRSAFLICIVITMTFFAVLVILGLKMRMKNQKIRVAVAEKGKSSAETELKKAWFLNELLKASAALLPQFVEDVSKEAVRGRKISKDFTDNLNSSIDSIRTLSRNRITAITKNDTFKSINPNLDYLPDLSDFEKIVLLLIDYCYTVQEISDLLNSSPSSIRSIKTKIKEKILAEEGLPFDPKTTFLIFK